MSGREEMVLCIALLAVHVAASEMNVTINADFPGGNVLVEKDEGSTVHVAPDLRGGRPWFYWLFEAEANQPGRVTFVFANPPKIGVRGPAVSLDGGKSWRWLGADHVQYASTPSGGGGGTRAESFHYHFAAGNQKVRFAVAIPYLQRELDEFLARNAANPHLTKGVLTKSREGRTVELLRVGEPGPDVKAVLVTARQHACESMASYLLEGFLQEAISDSPAGIEFRKRYVLYSVPIVDKDGVQAGDQGKNRRPHDHNRDWGEVNIYPEVKAIQKLAESEHIQFGLDLHCPALRGEVHTVFYFAGITIPHIHDNVNELIRWLEEERPPAVRWPHNFMKPIPTSKPVNNMRFSHYFAYKERMVLAATLEVPYTQPECPLDAAMARQYGASLLKAWVRTEFVTAALGSSRGVGANAKFIAFRNSFRRTYMSKPQEAEEMARVYLDDEPAPAIYRVEANNLMGMLRLRQRRFDDAFAYCQAVMEDVNATTNQRAVAMVQRTRIVCDDPKSTIDNVEASLAEFQKVPYPSSSQQFTVYEAVVAFCERKQDYERALSYARRQLPVASKYDKGKTLNRVAAIYDRLQQPERAIATRREAVEVLRQELDPVPVGIFGALMAGDLFDALNGIPTATLKDKTAAANIVLNHKVAPVSLKKRVREALANISTDGP